MVSMEEGRQQRLLEDHPRMSLPLQVILDIFKSFSILYQSPIDEASTNSENQVLQMTFTL